MGGAGTTHRGEERFVQSFGGGNQRQTHAKDLGADSMIILKWNSRTEDGRRGRDYLASVNEK